MVDGVSIATTAFFAVFLAARHWLARMERARLRAAGRELARRPLAHWRYDREDWQRYCEARRRDLWFDVLQPAGRLAIPALAIVVALCVVLESRSTLAPGLASAVALANVLAAAWLLLGPAVREFVQLSFRRRMDYELYLGETGVLEVWREGNRVAATNEHLFASGGRAIERVEARGSEQSEIVFSVGQRSGYGVIRLDERFPVPRGRLAEARELARRLTPARRMMPA